MPSWKKIFLVTAIILLIGILLFNIEFISSFVSVALFDSNDSYATESQRNPVILLHGYNPLYSKRIGELGLKEMQDKLAEDLQYSDKGILTSVTSCGQLQSEKPIIIRATYFDVFTVKSLEIYSAKVNSIITRIRLCTGAKKVDVVTYSMGGIVTRYAIKNNNAAVDKLVMLGTPNHGGLYLLGEVAELLAEKSSLQLDFAQLVENSNFMKRLNGGDETPGNTKYFTLAGNIDDKGDGLVLSDTVALEGSVHKEVDCNHLLMKSPKMCPEAYEFVKKALLN